MKNTIIAFMLLFSIASNAQNDINRIISNNTKIVGYDFIKNDTTGKVKLGVFGKFGMEWYDVRRYKLEKGKFKKLEFSKSRLMIGLNFFYEGNGMYYLLIDGNDLKQTIRVEVQDGFFDVALMGKNKITKM